VTARYQRAAPYAEDALALPVASVEAALPFYQGVMGFQLVERKDAPQAAAILARDNVRIGLAENGGDPTQEGCFFEVDDVEAAFAELQANGLGRTAIASPSRGRRCRNARMGPRGDVSDSPSY